jgi:hypothetical protein
MRIHFVVPLLWAVLAGCAQTQAPPQFRVDPGWPQPLAEENGVQLVLGQVAGIAVNEKNGHVWIVHRPATLLADEWDAKTNRPVTHRCCKSAPPVVEFDASGKYLRGWGPSGPQIQWPKTEHGIYLDPDGNVWIAGNGNEDHQILKFRPDGQFLLQIGRPGKSEGSNSREQLGRPAHMVLSGDELFVADGYGNRRVVVFDARTGAYKRHWGAYGGTPSDAQLPPYDPAQPLSRQFGNPVHCVRVSNDGKVYVCDRQNNRIQIFSKGGEFQGESASRSKPAPMARCGTWCCRTTRRRSISTWPTAPTAGSTSCSAPTARWSAPSAAPAAWRASSNGSTTSPSTATATSSPRRSASAGASRNSCAAAARSEPAQGQAGARRARRLDDGAPGVERGNRARRRIELVASRSPEDFSAYVRSEAEAFSKLVRDAGIKVE